MSDERRVRTMCGWVGVEISKCRVRTPGKAGYGLWRVRAMPRSTDLPEDLDEMWTAYAFTLEEIESQVGVAIRHGMADGPSALILRPDGQALCELVTVPTRWTAGYTGRRDLGVPVPVTVEREFADEVSALAALVDAGLVAMEHAPHCSCSGTQRLEVECVRRTTERETVRTRQREQNAEFQAAHLERRRHGKAAYHAAKLDGFRNVSG